MLYIFGFRCLFICNIFIIIISAELSLPLLPSINLCRSLQNSPNQCNFQDLSSKFIINEFLPFFEQLDPKQAEIFQSIFNDLSIAKSDVKVKLLQFAYTLPENLKQVFVNLSENSLKNAKMIEEEFDKMAENISTDAKLVYSQMKNIYKNDNLTLTQECEQLNTVINISPTTVIKELESKFGALTTCNPNIQEIIPPSPKSPSIGNNPPYDFNKGLLIPENVQPQNPFDLSQIFGLNNNNILAGGGVNPPLNPVDLFGSLNEVILLAKNLNNLMNGLQNLYNLNLNGLTKLPNGINLGSLLPPSINNNNNNNLVNPNPLANFNWNNLLMPNNNNNNNANQQVANYPNFYLPRNGQIDYANVNGNLMYRNPNSLTYPNFPQYPYSASA